MHISARKGKENRQNKWKKTIVETLIWNTHLGILGFMASPWQYLNKSLSSTRTSGKICVWKRRVVRRFEFSGKLPLYTSSQTPVPGSPFPVPRSLFPVPGISNIRVQLYNYGWNQACWWPIRFENFDIVVIIITMMTLGMWSENNLWRAE